MAITPASASLTPTTGTISTPGIGSNLDVSGIVSKLMAVEQQPLTDLNNKEASYQNKLSAMGMLQSTLSSFKGALQSLTNATQFQSINASATDSSVATATGGTTALPGTYSLEVTQLAQAQKLASAGQASSDTAIGTGTITFDFGTISGGTFDSSTGKYTGASFTNNGNASKSITIDSTNNTLTGIRDAINNAGMGVTASIVNDGSSTPYHLVLTNTSTGAANSMKISVSGGDPALTALMSQDPSAAPSGQGFSETSTAQDAKLKVDGVAITKSSNSISDAIQGVTLSLLKTNTGSPTTVTVARNTQSVTAAANQFVTAYNQLSTTIKKLTGYDPSTKQAGILNGDGTARTIQTQMAGLLAKPLTGAGAFSGLSDIGISLQKDGTLSLDSTKLQNAISSNFSSIAGVFAAVGNASDSLVSVTGNSSKTAAGTYALNITQMATQGKTIGGQAVANLSIDSSNDTIQIQVDGVSSSITLTHGTYADAGALAAELQAQINGTSAFSGAGVSAKVSQSAGVLTITSNRYGSASNVNITGGNGATNLIGATQTATAGLDVAGTINGMPATGSGQKLTGAVGSAVDGLELLISGGSTGSRGTINFSRGYADQFSTLATTLLGSSGPIASSTDGLNATIKDLESQKTILNSRLADIQARYQAQFTALDVTIGKMTQISTYLTQQLANLPKMS